MEKFSLVKPLIYSLVFLVVLQSCNNGENSNGTIQAPVVRLSDIQNKASCVFLTTDEEGRPVASWVETDSQGTKYFYFSYWDAVSRAFAPGRAIPIEQHASFHEEGMPKIAVRGDGALLATYETSVPSEKSRFGLSDIRYVMSFDRGETWTDPKSIQEVIPNSGSRSFSNLCRLDDGEIGIAWLDTDTTGVHRGRPVRFAKTGGGIGFEPSVLVDSAACECCRTAIGSDGNGHITIAFRDLHAGPIRDISISSSPDGGQTFAAATAFSGDNWQVDGCPHNGPSIVRGGGKTYITWFTGSAKSGVFYAELDGENNVVAKRQLNQGGRFAQLCMMPDGVRVAVYDVPYREGDAMQSKIKVCRIDEKGFFEREIQLPDSHASHPVVQPLGNQDVIVAWTDNGKVFYVQQDVNAIDG